MPTNFRPSQHGFPFANSFPSGTPVLEIPTPFGRIPVGDAAGGVCGGMIFAALDLFLAKQPIPKIVDETLFRYLCRRLLASFDLPFGVLRYYDWQRRPFVNRELSGVCIQRGVHALTLEEWPRIRALIDAGQPATLGLVKANSWSLQALSQNHQVLAYAYQENADQVQLSIYDPNYPADNDTRLRLAWNPTQLPGIEHSREGFSVRGFFVSPYRQPEAVPSFESS